MPAKNFLFQVALALLIGVPIASAGSPQSSSNTRSMEDLTTELGPFPVRDRRFTVVLHLKHLIGSVVPDPDWQTTLVELEIKDDDGIVHHQESFPYEITGNEFTESRSASARLLQGKEESGLLVTYGILPSTPLGGQSWQVFGMFDDKLVPLGKPIYAEGDLITPAENGTVHLANEPLSESEVLEFRVWTGNFFVVFPVRVDFVMGKVMPALRCVKMTSWGVESRCQYAIEADRRLQEEEMSFVRMHVEPEERIGVAEQVVVKPESTVEILAAEGEVQWLEDANGVALTPNDDFWIKVRIDGKPGWIHTQEDFLALGLPQAG